MSREIIAVLAGAFPLPEEERAILASPLRDLSRSGRRLYFGRLKSREAGFRRFLRETYASLSEEERRRWHELTVDSLLANRGEPDLSDALMMAVLGRLTVYRDMRTLAEERGVVLRALTSFGGIGMALYLFLFLALAVILFKYFVR